MKKKFFFKHTKPKVVLNRVNGVGFEVIFVPRTYLHKYPVHRGADMSTPFLVDSNCMKYTSKMKIIKKKKGVLFSEFHVTVTFEFTKKNPLVFRNWKIQQVLTTQTTTIATAT